MCGKCCDPITGMDVVLCRGYCGDSFHMSTCTGGVTRAMLNYFTTHKNNLFWMCDKCAALFENGHFRALSSRVDEQSPISTLTTAISELRTEINRLNSKPSALPVTPATNRWPQLDLRRPNKRPRDLDMMPSEKCRIGSKQPTENVVSVPICNKENENKFWLYLSKIRPDVANDAVCAMVKSNLALDIDPDIVKLVAKEKDISTLSFVSFKIGLDPSLKEMALDPATWPEGLFFREFEDYGVQKFRNPLKSRKPLTPRLQPQDVSPSLSITPVMELN